MNEAIRAPSQARSRKTMRDVYRSMDALLRERSFDRITIADLAAHADVAVGSIYARFKDKNALLAGLYLDVCEQAERCVTRLATPSRWRDRADEEMLCSVVAATDRFYRQHGHVLVAATLANVEQIEATRLRLWLSALEMFTALLQQREPEVDAARLRRAVTIAIRFTTAVMQQRMVIGSVSKWEGKVSNRLVSAELTRLIADLVERARSGTLPAG